MRVVPLPPHLPHHPLMDMLYTPMAALGVEVRRERPRVAIPALLGGTGARVLHLHFFDEIVQRPSRAASLLRTLGLLGMLAGLRARGVVLIWTAHNMIPHETYHPCLAARSYAAVAKLSHATIAHGEAARALVIQRYAPRRCVAIPLGNYIGAYGPPADRRDSRAALGLPQDGPVSLCLGALRRYKAIEVAIAAFAALPQNRRGVLLIAGPPKDARYTAELRALVDGVAGVRFAPHTVADADIPQYLAAADLMVLPYRRLLTSAALLLAMSYGLPALAPDVPPVRELIDNGVDGWLFAGDAAADWGQPPSGAPQLGAALGAALEYQDGAALGAAALARAAALDWPTIAARTVDVYRAALDNQLVP